MQSPQQNNVVAATTVAPLTSNGQIWNQSPRNDKQLAMSDGRDLAMVSLGSLRGAHNYLLYALIVVILIVMVFAWITPRGMNTLKLATGAMTLCSLNGRILLVACLKVAMRPEQSQSHTWATFGFENRFV